LVHPNIHKKAQLGGKKIIPGGIPNPKKHIKNSQKFKLIFFASLSTRKIIKKFMPVFMNFLKQIFSLILQKFN
jgi:hypothetical protein